MYPEDGHDFDEFAIAHGLRERGWVVPAYTMAPHSEGLRMMRVVVREDFSRSRCDALLADLKTAFETLVNMDAKKLALHKEHIKGHSKRSGKTNKMNQQFTGEKHSLQGKSGKTHAVC